MSGIVDSRFVFVFLWNHFLYILGLRKLVKMLRWVSQGALQLEKNEPHAIGIGGDNVTQSFQGRYRETNR